MDGILNTSYGMSKNSVLADVCHSLQKWIFKHSLILLCLFCKTALPG